MENSEHIIECAGVALINNGRIFLIRPLYNGIVQHYGIPKGHVEDDESAQHAANREFLEETGIDISGKPKTFLCYVKSKVDDGSIKRVTVYVVNGTGDEKFISSITDKDGHPENVGGAYITYENALELITSYQQPIIHKLMELDKDSFRKYFKNL